MKTHCNVVIEIMLAVTLAAFLFSCSSTKKTGFLDDYYQKMQSGPKGGAKERWLKPGVDFSKYNKVMLDNVVFYLAKDSEDKGIDSVQMNELANTFNREIVNALKDRYPIVAAPGPDVLRLRIALTGLRQSRPVVGAVSSVVPVGLGVSIVKKGTTGSWLGSGATSAEVMALDSTTNTVIGVAEDTQTAGFTKRFTKYGSADAAFKFWAERIRTFLDNAHAKTSGR